MQDLQSFLSGVEQRVEHVAATLSHTMSVCRAWWEALGLNVPPSGDFSVWRNDLLLAEVQASSLGDTSQSAAALVDRITALEAELAAKTEEAAGSERRYQRSVDQLSRLQAELNEKDAALERRTPGPMDTALPPPQRQTAAGGTTGVSTPVVSTPSSSGVATGGRPPRPSGPPPQYLAGTVPPGHSILACPPGAEGYYMYPGETGPAVAVLEALTRMLRERRLRAASLPHPPR